MVKPAARRPCVRGRVVLRHQIAGCDPSFRFRVHLFQEVFTSMPRLAGPKESGSNSEAEDTLHLLRSPLQLMTRISVADAWLASKITWRQRPHGATMSVPLAGSSDGYPTTAMALILKSPAEFA